MATARSVREIEEARCASEKNTVKYATFGDTSTGGAIRGLDLNTVGAGDSIVVPEDYGCFETMVNGNAAKFTVLESGLRFFPGGLSRGVSPFDPETGKNDNAARVRPTGDVIDFAQKCGDLDTFFSCVAGLEFKIGSMEKVTTLFRGAANPTSQNVWKDVNFTDSKSLGKAEKKLAEVAQA